MPTKKPLTPIDQAIAASGGLRSLARALGISAPSICGWRTGGVPAERVLAIEEITGVSRHDLRPDIYPREKRA